MNKKKFKNQQKVIKQMGKINKMTKSILNFPKIKVKPSKYH